jgi:hypothetical protein
VIVLLGFGHVQAANTIAHCRRTELTNNEGQISPPSSGQRIQVDWSEEKRESEREAESRYRGKEYL